MRTNPAEATPTRGAMRSSVQSFVKRGASPRMPREGPAKEERHEGLPERSRKDTRAAEARVSLAKKSALKGGRTCNPERMSSAEATLTRSDMRSFVPSRSRSCAPRVPTEVPSSGAPR